MIPGEYFLEADDIVANEQAEAFKIKVSNEGDRPVQVGSHYHFFETNRHLIFDRNLALGKRLNIPAGTAVRFEPGQTQEVELTGITGNGIIHGFNALVEGSIVDKSSRERAALRMTDFINEKK